MVDDIFNPFIIRKDKKGLVSARLRVIASLFCSFSLISVFLIEGSADGRTDGQINFSLNNFKTHWNFYISAQNLEHPVVEI